ncbi:hypothetical protein KSF78_0007657 [Schistosoma japonicum]|nr:hypothetical protein KSF78_0007657 [Schistosoma japonicum]
MSRYRLDDTCYVCDCSTHTSRNNLHLSYSFDSSLKYDIVLQDLMEWQVNRLHYELPPDWMCPSCNCDKTAVM